MKINLTAQKAEKCMAPTLEASSASHTLVYDVTLKRETNA